MSSITIILNYGVFIKPNPDYQQYLDSALEKSLLTNPDFIIICGGVTNSKYPELSEAESVQSYYLETHSELANKFLIEPTSNTTPQNLENSLEIIKNKNIELTKLNIICDSIRIPKVFFLSLSLFFPDLSDKDKLKILQDICLSAEPIFTYEYLSVSGIPLSNTIELAKHQIVSSMLEMHYLDYPDLHDQFIAWRKTIWGVK